MFPLPAFAPPLGLLSTNARPAVPLPPGLRRVCPPPAAPPSRRPHTPAPAPAPARVRACAHRDTDDHPLGHRFAEPARERPQCVLVGVEITTLAVDTGTTRIFSLQSSLDELAQLVDTAGLSVAATVSQTLPAPHPSTYIGSGKVSELRSTLHATGATVVVFDVDLSPAQQRSLEQALSPDPEHPALVLDRTAVILDIFAKHAATREGHLQVELAIYQYRLPRLTRLWTHLERQSGAGGVGLRGPGETQLEVDRRLIAQRVAHLKSELVGVRAHRARQRGARRRKAGLPVVALIGYTNAGKSTLLNALTGASALAADALFATLDPTTRRAQLAGLKMSPEILVTDTVGFVQNLPTLLVAAFRATLEEVTEADVLLHVVDASEDPQVIEWQMRAVDAVLADLDASEKPTVMVLNKVDLLDGGRAEEARQWVEQASGRDAVAVSARDATGLEDVGVLVDEVLRDAMFHARVVVPYDRGDITAQIYRQGSVLAEDFVAEGTVMTVRVPGELWRKLREFFADEEEGEEGEELVFGGGRIMPERGEEDMWAALAKKRHSATPVEGVER